MRKHVDILTTYVDDKTLKELGELVVDELNTLTVDQLKSTVVASLESMSEAAEQLGQNPKYQQVRRDLDYVTQGKKAVDKYQKAKITYARKRLRDLGKVPEQDLNELVYALRQGQEELLEKRFKASQAKDFVPVCSECNGRLGLNVDGERECYRCVTLHNDALLADEEVKDRATAREEAEAAAVAAIRAEPGDGLTDDAESINE